MQYASGRFKLFMDADNSVKIENLEKFIENIHGEYDIVIGSIAIPGAIVVEGNAWYRRFLGRISKWLIRRVAVPNVFDTQRGFKLFTSKAAETLFSLQTINGFGFDIELLAIARSNHLAVKELSVEWKNPRGSSVSFISYVQTLYELCIIKTNMMLGKYDVALAIEKNKQM